MLNNEMANHPHTCIKNKHKDISNTIQAERKVKRKIKLAKTSSQVSLMKGIQALQDEKA